MRATTERQFVTLLLDHFAHRGWRDGGEAALIIARGVGGDQPPLESLCMELPEDFLTVNTIRCGDVLDLLRELLDDRSVVSDAPSLAVTAYPVVQEIGASVMSQVRNCDGLDGQISADFLSLLGATVHYLRTRIDGDRSRFPFLFTPEPPLGLPLEDTLAEDYEQWLERTDPGGRLSTEARHVGGGRVDVLVTYSTHRFVVEVKRELADGSPAALRKYLAQTGIYTKTDVGVAILLVFDLTHKVGSIPRLSDSVWVEQLETGECIVVIRVPGNRTSPSLLSRRGSAIARKSS